MRDSGTQENGVERELVVRNNLSESDLTYYGEKGLDGVLAALKRELGRTGMAAIEIEVRRVPDQDETESGGSAQSGYLEQALRDLADDWQSDAELYLDSDVDCERSMATQQYYDAEEIRRILARHSDTDAGPSNCTEADLLGELGFEDAQSISTLSARLDTEVGAVRDALESLMDRGLLTSTPDWKYRLARRRPDECFADDCEHPPAEMQVAIDGVGEYGPQPLCPAHARENGQETLVEYPEDFGEIESNGGGSQ